MKRTAKDKLLDASVALLRAQGYSGTSVDEICEAAGVAKGSFYHFFGSKEELALAALDHFVQGNSKILMSGKFAQADDPKVKLTGFLDHSAKNARRLWEEGCLMGTFAAEVSSTGDKIQKRISELLSDTVDALAPLFTAAETKGFATAGELAEQYVATVEGAIVMAKAHGQPKRIAEAIEEFKKYVSLLMER